MKIRLESSGEQINPSPFAEEEQYKEEDVMIRIQEQCHEISEKPKETGSHAYANTDKLKSISNQLTFNYISNQGY